MSGKLLAQICKSENNSVKFEGLSLISNNWPKLISKKNWSAKRTMVSYLKYKLK